MEILLNLLFILPIIYWFYKMRETQNPYIYAGVLVLAALGTIITISSDPYITQGYTEDYTYTASGSGGQHIETITVEPIKQDLGAWSYVLLLFYLMSMLGSVIYWSLRGENNEI